MQAALEWTGGNLSGQKIHKLLGDDSPGERHLVNICKRIIDRAAALGYTEHAGEQYRVVKIRKGFYLVPAKAQSDELDELLGY